MNELRPEATIRICPDRQLLRVLVHDEAETCDPDTMAFGESLRSVLEQLGDIEHHEVNGSTQVFGGYFCG